MENVMLLVIGIVAAVIGVVNIRGNISTIHSYNRRNAREEDVPPHTEKRWARGRCLSALR